MLTRRGSISFLATCVAAFGCRAPGIKPSPTQGPDDIPQFPRSENERAQPTVMALSPGFWQDSALREWTKSHDPNVAPDASHPLIFIAAEHDNERAASILLSAGARIDKTDNLGQTALQVAVARNDQDMAVFLLRHGADGCRLGINHVHSIYFAAGSGEIRVLKEAIKEKVNLNAPSGIAGTAARRAILSGNVEALDLLIKHGGDIQSPLCSPVHLAAIIGCFGAQTYLLTKDGSHEDPRRRHGDVIARAKKMIPYLKKRGCSLDARDSQGRTPLHYAALADNLLAAQTLIAAGARPGIRDDTGKTPSQVAFDRHSSEVYKFLHSMKAG